MYTHFYTFVQKLFIAFTLFLTLNLTAQTTTSCAKYEVVSTNNNCGCPSDIFRPYGLFMEANNACGLEFYKPDTVIFEIRNDSTAAIRGVFRTFDGWRPVRVDISLAKLPTSTPRLDLCLANGSPSTSAWRYFGAMSGTIQFDSAAPLSISLRGANFQVGIGANGQNTDLFGGSGFFTLSNGQRGGFGFTLTNPTAGTCLLTDPCQADATPPAFSLCPLNINLTTSGTSAVATWTAPTATDNCTTPSVTSNFSSGATFPIGTTSVIYTARDAANNTAQCQFNVVVRALDPCLNDITPPVFANCPQNINLSTSGTSAVATWTAPTATDNCTTSPSVTSSFSSGDAFPVGTTTVVYTASDRANNTATCRFNVVVTRLDPCQNDVTPPVFVTCPPNITLTTAATNAVATWTAPTVTDNCAVFEISSTYPSGTAFPVGSTTVVYTANDRANNTAQCRFNVLVTRLDPCLNDVIAPVFSNCPTNISVTTTGANATATWTAPTATDNCTTPSVTSNFASGASFPVGTTAVIYTARDVANNSAQCRFDVTVTRLDPCQNDVTAPVFSNCPQNINVTTGGTSANVTWTAPTVTDNCTTPSVTSNYASGSSFSTGSTTIIYTARDAAGNTTQCRFIITVTYANPCIGDTVPPVIVNCPQNITVSTIGTNAVATWGTPSVTDNCAPFTISSTYPSGTAFPIGTTTVTYTASDVANNTSQCRFTVTVTRIDPCQNDVTAPVFSNCPQNINLSISGTSVVATWTAPTATDNCTTASVTSNISSGSTFLIGTTTVIYTARDAAGNTSQCRFNVVVTKRTTTTAGTCTSYAVENTNDICGCPASQWTPYGLFIERGGGCGEYYKADKVDFQINGDSSARLVGLFRTNTWRPVWLDIQWAKSDEKAPRFSTCANDTAASQNWRYFGTAQGNIQFDEEHPLSITNNGLLQVGMSANGQNRDFFGASGRITIGDGRAGSINIVLNSPISSTCSLACVNDSVAPKILNCPKNITQLVVRTPVAVTWPAPSVRDDCSSPTLSTTHLPGALFGEGETNVIYTARDVNGNQGTCSFKVTINKVAPGSLCSTYDVSNTNDICGCSASQWKPYALRIGAGNCGEYYKTDSVVLHVNGDSTAQLQGRFRSDTWQPVIVEVTFAKTSEKAARYELCQSSNSNAVDWQYFGAMSGTIRVGDAPAVAIQASSLLQIGKGANGQNPNIPGGSVRFTLANGTSASFNMVLENYQQFTCPNFDPCTVDVLKPTFNNCPSDTIIETALSSAVVRWTEPTATDNCTTPSVTSNFVSGATFPLGATAVTYTAKDVAGNSNTCRFTVAVKYVSPCAVDAVPPVIANCPSDITVLATGITTIVSWTPPSATDNCSTPSLASNFPPGLPFNIGTTIIIYTARDMTGNRSQCHFKISVFTTATTDPNAPISEIKVGPNPATQQITIHLQSQITDEIRLDISNALGQTLLQQKADVKTGENHFPIDISSLTKGIYYLTVRNAQSHSSKTVRFMKI